MTKLPTKPNSKLPRKRGPKIKFNDELKGQYLELVREGLPKTTAAEGVGVAYQTVLRHRETDEDFAMMEKRAGSEATRRRIEKIERSEDWRSAAWLLKHSPASKKDWAESGSGHTGAPFVVQINVDRSVDPFPPPVTIENEEEEED